MCSSDLRFGLPNVGADLVPHPFNMSNNYNQEYIEVPLSETEVMVCNYIGKLRNHVTSQHANDRKQDQTLDGVQISINGVITEYAVSKFLQLPFDLNCNYRKFGADLVTRKGKTIDVKCTSKVGGNLNAVVWSGKKPVDAFILTEIHNTCVRIIGWINSKDFLIDENLFDVGNGEYYSVRQSELIPFERNYHV